MSGIENYLGFILAGFILNITPGSDTMYILARSISQGKKAGIVSVLGISIGCFVHTIFAAIGLSAILATSTIVFNIVKYIGVAYLIFLGIKTLLEKSYQSEERFSVNNESHTKILFQGIFTNISNPKVALFFMSFLPQFIKADQSTFMTFIFLGLTFIITGTAWCLFLAITASSFSVKLRDNPIVEKVMKKISGMVFILLGIKLGLSKS